MNSIANRKTEIENLQEVIMPRSKRKIGLGELRVGLLVLIAIGVFVFLILNASGELNPFASHLHLRARFPGATVRIDSPTDPAGTWFIDVRRNQRALVIQWKQGRGFGFMYAQQTPYSESNLTWICEYLD